MSENLDLVRSIYTDWERGDFSSTDWADREIEFVIADGPAPGRWTGMAGMAAGFRDPLSAWEDFRAEADAYRELDNGSVLVLLRAGGGRGKTSRLDIGEMRTRGANVFHISGSKVTRLVVYLDRDQALADLGLNE